ncbi:hypothetical protein ABPG77_005996 [Micractinium sp. CCAP 211/92]
MDPYSLLGVQPGASKADIKKAFFQKAKQHHPDMHTTASENVQKAHDAAFRALNEAYQALMDGTYRPRQRGAAGRAGYASGGAFYGGAAGAAGGPHYGAYHDPFASSYGENVGRGYWGYRNFGRHAGLDFRAAFRAFTSISRAEVAATAALGLLLAGGATLLEDTSQSLWARHNHGKLFDSIQQDVEKRKQQKEQAAAEAAAASAALRAATAAMRQQAAASDAPEAAMLREAAALAGPPALAAAQPAENRIGGSSSDVQDSIGGGSSSSSTSGGIAGRGRQGAVTGPVIRQPPGQHGPGAAVELATGSSRSGSPGRADASEDPAPPLAPGKAHF